MRTGRGLTAVCVMALAVTPLIGSTAHARPTDVQVVNAASSPIPVAGGGFMTRLANVYIDSGQTAGCQPFTMPSTGAYQLVGGALIADSQLGKGGPGVYLSFRNPTGGRVGVAHLDVFHVRFETASVQNYGVRGIPSIVINSNPAGSATYATERITSVELCVARDPGASYAAASGYLVFSRWAG